VHVTAGIRRRHPHVVAHQADDLRIRLLQRRLDLAQFHPGRLAAFRHQRLGEVDAGIEALDVGLCAPGHQAPADEADENDTQGCHRKTDGGEIEHAEAAEPGLGAQAGDDEIGRGADQGGGATEDGAEGERHQHLAGRQVEAR